VATSPAAKPAAAAAPPPPREVTASTPGATSRISAGNATSAIAIGTIPVSTLSRSLAGGGAAGQRAQFIRNDLEAESAGATADSGGIGRHRRAPHNFSAR
jgi:hypothetical protein